MSWVALFVTTVDEDVSLALGIGDCSAVMGRGLIVRELVSGVLFRPQMTFHTSGLSAFDIELCERSFQLLALASLIATFASRQASIHSCQ